MSELEEGKSNIGKAARKRKFLRLSVDEYQILKKTIDVWDIYETIDVWDIYENKLRLDVFGRLWRFKYWYENWGAEVGDSVRIIPYPNKRFDFEYIPKNEKKWKNRKTKLENLSNSLMGSLESNHYNREQDPKTFDADKLDFFAISLANSNVVVQ